jgi:hypothetical protein
MVKRKVNIPPAAFFIGQSYSPSFDKAFPRIKSSFIFSRLSPDVVTVGICDIVRSVSSTYENPAMYRVSPDKTVL